MTRTSTAADTLDSVGDPPLRDHLARLEASLRRTLAGRYVLGARIGAGGMGVVFRARHATLGHAVAIKVLRRDVSSGGLSLERMRREALSASRIDSVHVVNVYDFGQLRDGAPYLIMEHLDGRDLGEELIHEGLLSWGRIRTIALSICDALGHAHSAGIVHRDLKPENVFLAQQHGREVVKIVDFGLAKLTDAVAITAAGSTLGTPEYMSPEQCRGEPADARSDIYALGAMLYEMLCGYAPFEGDNVLATLSGHMYEAPEPLQGRAPTLPDGVEALVMRCLEKDPSVRFQSAATLQQVIEATVPNHPFVPSDAQPTPAASPPSASPPRAPSDDTGPRFTRRLTPSEQTRVPPTVVRTAPRRGLGVALTLLVTAAGAAYIVSTQTAPRGVAQITSSAEVSEPALPERSAEEPPEVAVEAHVIEPEPRSVRIETTPPGARVWVDGDLLGATPVEIPRGASGASRGVRIALRGYFERELRIGARTNRQLHLSLRPERPVRTTRAARLTSPTSPPALEAPPESPPEPSPREIEARTQVFDPWGS